MESKHPKILQISLMAAPFSAQLPEQAALWHRWKMRSGRRGRERREGELVGWLAGVALLVPAVGLVPPPLLLTRDALSVGWFVRSFAAPHHATLFHYKAAALLFSPCLQGQASSPSSYLLSFPSISVCLAEGGRGLRFPGAANLTNLVDVQPTSRLTTSLRLKDAFNTTHKHPTSRLRLESRDFSQFCALV